MDGWISRPTNTPEFIGPSDMIGSKKKTVPVKGDLFLIYVERTDKNKTFTEKQRLKSFLVQKI